jgi:GTPase
VTGFDDGRPDASEDAWENTRSGFVALAGRPNVGKSTLVNAIVGGKVAIVSDRPQTTRRAIRGVRTDGSRQLVLVDLPGVQRPRDVLTERMAGRVRQELEGSDAALLLLNGEQGVGPGDRFIAAALTDASTPITIAVNKVDRLDRAATVAMLQAAAELGVGEEIFPISARTGKGVPELVEHLFEQMPEGPFMFSPEDISDQPLSLLLAELIR